MTSEPLFPEVTERRPGGEGILPYQEIRQFVETGIIRSTRDVEEDQIQPSSIDLRLSHEAYRVRASFMPGKSTTLLNKGKSNGMLSKKFDISTPSLLEPGVIYLIPLMESLALPDDVYGIANPKSTTGRLDIFTRLVTEHGNEFDRLGHGYSGNLFVEVIPQSFPIFVQAGMRLNQLRFARGKVDVASDFRLRKLDQGDQLIGGNEDGDGASIDRGVRLTVDLKGNGSNIVAYQAIKFSSPIDLNKINHYEIAEFWRPIYKDSGPPFILAPGEFYILASKQRVRVPPDYAAEMLPYDLATQEFRVHYAGFFDPGFGYGEQGEIPGTRAVLEVRANGMPILLEDDQFVGRLNYYKMAAMPKKVYGGAIGSSYQQQGLALSKQFKREDQYTSSYRLDDVTATNVDPAAGAQQGVARATMTETDDKTEGMFLNFAALGNRVEYAVTAKAREG